MNTASRLSEVLEKAQEVPIDKSSKFILFSDVHRGDNSWSDDFAPNQNLLFHALSHYRKHGFTYFELGDGDEFWENASFSTIREAHSHIFWIMREFHKDKRLYMLWGNHDRKWKRHSNVEKYLHKYFDEREQKELPLLDGIVVHEGLKLIHQESGLTLLLVHGHQGELLNDQLWWLGRFVVRNFWKVMQRFGVKDPTRPAKNFARRQKRERKIVDWATANKQPIVIGHTHRPALPRVGQAPYFNTGSCVHPRCITGIEIENGEISLVKWFTDVARDDSGTLFINKEVIVGPIDLRDYRFSEQKEGKAEKWDAGIIYDHQIDSAKKTQKKKGVGGIKS